MPEQTRLHPQLHVGDARVARRDERVGDLALLPGGEEDVAGHAEDEDGVCVEGGEACYQILGRVRCGWRRGGGVGV